MSCIKWFLFSISLDDDIIYLYLCDNKTTMKNKLMTDLDPVRVHDVYLHREIEETCKSFFFPENTLQLALDQSNVTSAFYGLALKNIIELYGKDSANIISEKIFYDLGRIKTQQCKVKLEKFPQDTTAFAFVIICAIYNGSPEYNFHILKFSAKETIIKMFGVDRYLRILAQLEIDDCINFPTLTPFMKGINDELQLDCRIEVDSKIDKQENTTSTTYKFSI